MATTKVSLSANIVGKLDPSINKKYLNVNSDGVVQQGGGRVWIEDDNGYLVPIITTDSYGNYQEVIRSYDTDDVFKGTER